MEAERLEQIAMTLADQRARADGARRGIVDFDSEASRLNEIDGAP